MPFDAAGSPRTTPPPNRRRWRVGSNTPSPRSSSWWGWCCQCGLSRGVHGKWPISGFSERRAMRAATRKPDNTSSPRSRDDVIRGRGVLPSARCVQHLLRPAKRRTLAPISYSPRRARKPLVFHSASAVQVGPRLPGQRLDRAPEIADQRTHPARLDQPAPASRLPQSEPQQLLLSPAVLYLPKWPKRIAPRSLGSINHICDNDTSVTAIRTTITATIRMFQYLPLIVREYTDIHARHIRRCR